MEAKKLIISILVEEFGKHEISFNQQNASYVDPIEEENIIELTAHLNFNPANSLSIIKKSLNDIGIPLEHQSKHRLNKSIESNEEYYKTESAYELQIRTDVRNIVGDFGKSLNSVKKYNL